MCGIAGYLQIQNAENKAEASVKAMAAPLTHRGPDDAGVWVEPDEGRLALAHQRLSIIDLSAAGAQPMHSASGRYTIVYNGEIYNFQALRSELEPHGFAFKGHSDTEVLLAAFEHWGIEEALKRITGMFALALYDAKTRELTLTRDRLGKKPLYFGWSADVKAFAFASELKAFMQTEPFQKPDINNEAVQLYLQWRYVPDPHTIYKNIWKMPPAQFITLPLETFAKPFAPEQHAKTYWDFEAVAHQEHSQIDEHEALNGLEDVLMQAVGERMISDVPLGAFLSGGIDSALIVALMQKQADQPVNSYTIAFEDPRYNEAEQAAQIAKHLGTNHTEMMLSASEALGTVDHMAQIFDEPFGDPSAIPTYHVCRLARQNITVALSGDGGDESFGGYSWYKRAQKLQSFLSLPLPLRKTLAGILTAVPLSGTAQRQKIAALLRAKDKDEIYPLLHTYWSAVTGRSLGNTETPYSHLRDNMGLTNLIERMMAFDTRMFLAGDVLTKTDRCSMAHSLELRSPLLDHRVVEYAWTMPLNMKINGGTQKYALKQLLQRHLPDELIDQPKRGFSIPHGQWLKDDLRDWAQDLLSPDALQKYDLIAPELVQPYWEEHLSGRTDYGHYLWTIVFLQNWAQKWR